MHREWCSSSCCGNIFIECHTSTRLMSAITMVVTLLMFSTVLPKSYHVNIMHTISNFPHNFNLCRGTVFNAVFTCVRCWIWWRVSRYGWCTWWTWWWLRSISLTAGVGISPWWSRCRLLAHWWWLSAYCVRWRRLLGRFDDAMLLFVDFAVTIDNGKVHTSRFVSSSIS